jgi:hypothetical protein
MVKGKDDVVGAQHEMASHLARALRLSSRVSLARPQMFLSILFVLAMASIGTERPLSHVLW